MRPQKTNIEADVLVAQGFAAALHRQQRWGDLPYYHHLRDVYRTVQVYYGGPYEDYYPTLCAAWLHDSLEDTDVTPFELEGRFGRRVAHLVQLVTDEPGKNRKERKEKTYPKIRQDPYAVLIKLADRLSNVQFSAKTSKDSGHFQMYVKEYPAFRAALRKEGEWDVLWEALDEAHANP